MERVAADRDNEELRKVIENQGIIGRGPVMMDVADKIIRYGRTGLNVLITGETGTGKKLAAQAIHCREPSVQASSLSPSTSRTSPATSSSPSCSVM